MENLKTKIKTLFFITLFSGITFSQSVRSLNNDGVELYENKKFPEAEVNFKKAIDKDLESFHSHFNLGGVFYKQNRFDEAIKSYQNALALAKQDMIKSGIYHNIGNSLLKGKKLKEAVEAYKNALKLNPDDFETKYNLSYALDMMKQQQKQKKQQNKSNKNNKNKKKKNDKNKNKNQNKNKDQKDNKNQKNKNDQNKDQKNNQNKKQNSKQNQQQQKQKKTRPDKISKAEAQRILNALKNNESDLQKKLRVKKGKVVKKEKDW